MRRCRKMKTLFFCQHKTKHPHSSTRNHVRCLLGSLVLVFQARTDFWCPTYQGIHNFKNFLIWILSTETSRGSRMFILKFAICFSFNFFSLKISYPLNHRKTFYLSSTWNNRPQPSNENNKNTQVTLNIVKYKINIWVFLSLPTFFTYLWKHRGKTISCEGENWARRVLIASL